MTDEMIGKRIVVLRGEMSQREVAAAMRARGWKWSQTTVWSIESGSRPLRLAEAIDMSDIINATLDDVAGIETGLSAIRVENLKMRSRIDRVRAALGD